MPGRVRTINYVCTCTVVNVLRYAGDRCKYPVYRLCINRYFHLHVCQIIKYIKTKQINTIMCRLDYTGVVPQILKGKVLSASIQVVTYVVKLA